MGAAIRDRLTRRGFTFKKSDDPDEDPFSEGGRSGSAAAAGVGGARKLNTFGGEK
jgi:hypothetical protein